MSIPPPQVAPSSDVFNLYVKRLSDGNGDQSQIAVNKWTKETFQSYSAVGSYLTFYSVSGQATITISNPTFNHDLSALAKYDANGYPLWALYSSGSEDSNYITGITVDPTTGDVYATGVFGTFLGSPGTTNFYSSNGSRFPKTLTRSAAKFDSFLLKANSDGIIQWVTQFTGVGSQDVSFDTTLSHVIITFNMIFGSGSTNVTIYNANGTVYKVITVGSNFYSFIMALDPNGNGLWLANTVSPGASTVSDDLGANGSIYYAQQFSSSFTAFNSDGSIFLSSPGVGDYLFHLNSQGIFQWYSHITGSENSLNGAVVSVDTQNERLYLSGIAQDNTITFYNSDQSLWKSYTVPNGAIADYSFVAAYDLNGFGVWTTFLLGSTAGVLDLNTIPVIKVDLIDHGVYWVFDGVGSGTDTLGIYNNANTLVNTITMNDSITNIYVVKFSDHGNYLWSTTNTASLGLNEQSSYVGADTDYYGNLYITYTPSGTVNIYDKNGLKQVIPFSNFGGMTIRYNDTDQIPLYNLQKLRHDEQKTLYSKSNEVLHSVKQQITTEQRYYGGFIGRPYDVVHVKERHGTLSVLSNTGSLYLV